MKGFIFSFLILITMCEKDDDNSCFSEHVDNNIVCYEIYSPVCGCDNTTYSNDCYAEASGVVNWTTGECPKKL